jgi:hypothetical protein
LTDRTDPTPSLFALAGTAGDAAGRRHLWAERYRWAHLSLAECRLLYEMLRSVGCGETDDVYAALLAEVVRREQARARGRTAARRRGREA